METRFALVLGDGALDTLSGVALHKPDRVSYFPTLLVLQWTRSVSIVVAFLCISKQVYLDMLYVVSSLMPFDTHSIDPTIELNNVRLVASSHVFPRAPKSSARPVKPRLVISSLGCQACTGLSTMHAFTPMPSHIVLSANSCSQKSELPVYLHVFGYIAVLTCQRFCVTRSLPDSSDHGCC